MLRNNRNKEQIKLYRKAASHARKYILAEVNAIRDPEHQKVLGGKHIQLAVCIARRNQLVEPEIIELAGFNRYE